MLTVFAPECVLSPKESSPVNVFYQSSGTKKRFNFIMENDAGIQSLFLKRQQF